MNHFSPLSSRSMTFSRAEKVGALLTQQNGWGRGLRFHPEVSQNGALLAVLRPF